MAHDKDDQGGEDVFQAWIHGLNVADAPDPSEASDPQERDRRALDRQAKVAAYARHLAETLQANPTRLAAAAEGCRARAAELGERVASGDDRIVAYWVGAEIADVAAKMLQDAGVGSDPEAQERLLQEWRGPGLPPYRQGLTHRHSWPRRILRRGNPRWWTRRWIAKQSARLSCSEAATDAESIRQINIYIHQTQVGKLKYQLCAECRQGRIGKVSIDTEHQGLGLGTQALRAALAQAPKYDWHTTWQYETARTYWRLASRRTRTSLSDKHAAACPHMETHSSARRQHRAGRGE